MFSTLFVFERSGIVTSCRARFWRQLEPDFYKKSQKPRFFAFSAPTPRGLRARPWVQYSRAALGAVFTAFAPTAAARGFVPFPMFPLAVGVAVVRLGVLSALGQSITALVGAAVEALDEWMEKKA